MIASYAVLIIIFSIIIVVLFSDHFQGRIWKELKFEIIFYVLSLKGVLEHFLTKNTYDIELSDGNGKIAVVTGGARGIGVGVVKLLLRRHVHVIIGCRNVSAGQHVYKTIRQDDGITTGSVEVFELDLNSLTSVRRFAEVVKQTHSKIDILINNAGKLLGPYMESDDGYESHLSTNYLGHTLLTYLLLPELKAGGKKNNHSRIVYVSSSVHPGGNKRFTCVNDRQQYSAKAAYMDTKLAMILFSNYLNKLLKQEDIPISTYSVDPGVVDTGLIKSIHMSTFIPKCILNLLKTPEEGAVSILYACLSAELENKGGTYISYCQIASPSKTARDITAQKNMFMYTMQLLNIKNFHTQ